MTPGGSGYTFLTLDLPFLSYAVDQPTTRVVVTLTAAETPLSTPLPLRFRSAFWRGQDELDNPNADPPVLDGSGTNATAWPLLATITITPPAVPPTPPPDVLGLYINSFTARSVQSNAIHTFSVDIRAPTDLVYNSTELVVSVPNRLEYVSHSITGGGETVVAAPVATGQAQNAPNSTFRIRFDLYTGTASAVDKRLSINVRVPLKDANGNYVIDPIAGGSTSIPVTADLTAVHNQPNGTAPPIVITKLPESLSFTRSCVVTSDDGGSKSVSIHIDYGNSGYSPGDVLRYTITWPSLSDRYSLGDIIVTDTISDGQRLNSTFPAVLSINGGADVPFVLSDTMLVDTSNIAGDANPATDGSTIITFNVTKQIATFNMSGSGPPYIMTGPFSYTIRYYVNTVDMFSDDPRVNSPVVQGDALSNSATFSQNHYNISTAHPSPQVLGPRPSFSRTTQTSSNTGTLLAQTVYAIDGVVCPGLECSDPQLIPGTNATLRMRYTMPFSSYDQLQFTFFLPYPIMDLTAMSTVFSTNVSGVPPPRDQVKFGPTETLYTYSGLSPDINVTIASNRIDFIFPRYNDPQNRPSVIDVLMTVPVTTVTGFEDRTNLQVVSYSIEGDLNTQNGQVASTQLIVLLRQPSLHLASTAVHVQGQGTPSAILPSQPTTLASLLAFPHNCSAQTAASDFTAQGVAGANSSTITELDAGDDILFALIVTNNGGAPAYDVSVRLTIPYGYEIQDGICVFNGQRQVIASSVQTTGLDTVVTLVDPAERVGALDVGTGVDVVLLVYTLRANNSLVMGHESVVGHAITGYFGGPESNHNHISVPVTANSTLYTETVNQLTSTIAATSLTQSGSSQLVATRTDASLGEDITYQTVIHFPEGITENGTLQATFPSTLQFISAAFIIGNNLTVVPSYQVSTPTRTIAVHVGQVLNVYDNAVSSGDELVFQAVLRNLPANDNFEGTVSNTTFDLQMQPQSTTWQAPTAFASYVEIETVEPKLCVTRFETGSPTGDAADSVSFAAELAHCAGSTATAYNVVWTDGFYDIFAYVSGATTFGSVASPVSTWVPAEERLVVSAPVFNVGETLLITYMGQVRAGTTPGAYVHHMNATWSSAPSIYDVRNYTVKANATFTASNPVISTVAIVNTTLNTTGYDKHTGTNVDLAIGEQGSVQATVRLSEGSYPDDVILTLKFPAIATQQLNLLGNHTVLIGSDVTVSQTQVTYTGDEKVVFNFGSVTNAANNVVNAGDDITVLVDFVVPNVLYNTNGQTLTVTANLTSGAIKPSESSAVIDIVEPKMFVFKNSNTTVGDGGDAFFFTVDFSHDNQPPVSTSTLYNFTLVDLPSSDLTLDCSSFKVVTSPVPITFDTGVCTSENVLQLTGSQLDIGQSVTISYVALMNDTVSPSSRVENEARLTGLSTPYSSKKVYSFNASVSIITDTPETTYEILNHTVASTNFSQFSADQMDLAVGERIVIRITSRLPEGSMFIENDIQLPTSPGKLVIVDAVLQSIGANIFGSSLKIGDPPSITTDTDSDGLIDFANFAFDTLTNNPDGVKDEKDLLVMDVVAELADVAANTQGTPIEIKTTTRFLLGDRPCYETTWFDGKKKQVMFPVSLPDKTAVEFYSYGTPNGASANTGHEQIDTTLMYFVIDKTNQTAFVLVHDLPGNSDGGEVVTTIQSDSLAGLDIELLLEDDPNEGYVWDKSLGMGQFNHRWVGCCTDGAVLGYFPQKEFCFRPSFDIKYGINRASLMVQNPQTGAIEYTYIPLNELGGLEVCGYTCNEATRTLSSKTSTFKFDVVEPVLQVTKVANISQGDARDVVHYTIDIEHRTTTPTSHSTAFEVQLTDVPTFFDILPNSISLSHINASLASPIISGNETLVINLPTMLLGEKLTVSFDGIIRDFVAPFLQYENLGNVTYESHQVARGRKYTEHDKHSMQVKTPVLIAYAVKDPSSASINYRFHDNAIVDVSIGRKVLIDITYSLSEASQVLNWTVATSRAGVELLWGNVTHVGDALVSSGLYEGLMANVSDSNADGVDDALNINIGALANVGDNVADQRDQFTIRFQARVYEHNLNQDGATFDLDASLNYQNNKLDSTLTLEIVEPFLVSSKHANVTVADSGDIVSYNVSLSHVLTQSTADAHNVSITDVLPAEARLIHSSIVCSLPCVSQDSNNEVQVFLPVQPWGTSFWITYNVWLNDTVVYDNLLHNSAQTKYMSWYSAQRRDYHTKTTTNATIASPTQEFFLNRTSLAETASSRFVSFQDDLSVGELFTVQALLTFPEGTSTTTTCTIRFPSNATYGRVEVRNAAIVSIGHRITISTKNIIVSGTGYNDTVVFDFGTLVNWFDNSGNSGDTILVEVTGYVMDHATNVPGAQVAATSDLRTTGPHRYNDLVLDVVQSSLQISKTVNATAGDAGDVIMYTVTLSHAPGSSGPAYNVSITDTISGFMQLQGSDVTSNRGTVTSGVDSLRVHIPVFDRTEPAIVVRIPVVVQSSVTPDQVVVNKAVGQWYTADVQGRHFQIESTNNDLTVSTVSIFNVTVINTTLAQTAASHHDASRIDVAPEEVVAVELSTTLPEGTTNVTLTLKTDIASGVLDFDGSSVSFIGSRLSFLDGVVKQGHGTGIYVTPTLYRAALGRVLNSPDNVVTENDRLRIVVYLRVADHANNVDGAVASISAALSFDQGVLNDGLSLDIVEPKPSISYAASASSGDAGDSVVYTLTARNDATATSPMYDTVVTVTNIPHVAFQPGSFSCSGCTVHMNTASGFNVTLPRIDVGNHFVISYTVVMADTIGYATPAITHTAYATSFSHSPKPARSYARQNSTTFVVENAATFLTFTAQNSSLVETNASYHNNTLQDVSIGEKITFRSQVRLREGRSKLTYILLWPQGGAVADPMVHWSVGIIPTAQISVVASTVTSISSRDADIFADNTTIVFPEILNSPDNTADALDIFTVEFTAIIGNESSAVDGHQMSPQVSVDDTHTVTSKHTTIDIVEPVLAISSMTTNITQAIADAPRSLHSDLPNGSPILVTITVSAQGNSRAPAFAISLTDVLDGQTMMLAPGTVTTTMGTVSSGNGGTDKDVVVDVPLLLPTQSFTVTFVCFPSPSTPTGSMMFTNVTLDYASVTGTGIHRRAYQDRAGAQVFLQPPGPTIVAVVANDPDDGDHMMFSAADTITVTFSEATNQPGISSKAQLLAQLSFSQSLGTDFIGTWLNASALVITILDPLAATPPVIGTLQVSARGTLTDAASVSSPSRHTSAPITGDWGRQGPQIQSITADDPDNADAVYSAGDIVTIAFTEDTNRPAVATDAEVRALLDIGTLGTNVTGFWTSPRFLQLTVANPTTTPSQFPVVGNYTLTVKAAGNLRDDTGFTLPSFATSPVLLGDWGLAAGPEVNLFLANDPDDLDTVFSSGDTLAIGFDAKTNQPDISSKVLVDNLFTFMTANLGVNYTGSWMSAAELSAAGFPASVRDAAVISIHNASGHTNPEIGNLRVQLKRASPYVGLTNAAATTFASVHISDPITGDWGMENAPMIIAFVADDPDDGDIVYSAQDTMTILFNMDTNQPGPVSTAAHLNNLLTFSTPLVNATGTWLSARQLLITVVGSQGGDPGIGSLQVTALGTKIKNVYGNSSDSQTSSMTLAGDWGQQKGPTLLQAIANDPDDGDSVYSTDDTITLYFSSPTDQSGSLDSNQVFDLLSFNQGMGVSLSGSWFNASVLVLTVVDSTAAAPPVIGQLEISVKDQRIRRAGGSSAYTSQHTVSKSIVTGDWGLLAGPRVVSLVATDPDNADAIFSAGDVITMTFSEGTSRPPLNNSALIDQVLIFSQSIGTSYTGTWVTPSVAQITIVNASAPSSTVSTPAPFWNIDGSTRPGTLTVSARPGAIISEDRLKTASIIPSPPITGDWGRLLGPRLHSIVMDDPDDLDAVFGQGDVITLVFKEDTNQANLTTHTQLMACASFWKNTTGSTTSQSALRLAQAASMEPLSLGTVVTSRWTSPRSLRIEIVDASGASQIPRDPKDFIVSLRGYVFLASGDSLPTNTWSTDVGISGGDWGQLPGPVIVSLTADDPDDADRVFSDGDVLVWQFAQAVNQVDLSTKAAVDHAFSFSVSLGANYTGTWTNNGTVVSLSIVNSTGHGDPLINQLTVTALYRGNLTNLAGTSLPSTSTSPAIQGDWGLALVDIGGGGGRLLDDKRCQTFWCLLWWVLVLATMACIVGCALLYVWYAKFRDFLAHKAHREAAAALSKRASMSKVLSAADLEARHQVHIPAVKKKSGLPTLMVGKTTERHATPAPAAPTIGRVPLQARDPSKTPKLNKKSALPAMRNPAATSQGSSTAATPHTPPPTYQEVQQSQYLSRSSLVPPPLHKKSALPAMRSGSVQALPPPPLPSSTALGSQSHLNTEGSGLPASPSALGLLSSRSKKRLSRRQSHVTPASAQRWASMRDSLGVGSGEEVSAPPSIEKSKTTVALPPPPRLNNKSVKSIAAIPPPWERSPSGTTLTRNVSHIPPPPSMASKGSIVGLLQSRSRRNTALNNSGGSSKLLSSVRLDHDNDRVSAPPLPAPGIGGAGGSRVPLLKARQPSGRTLGALSAVGPSLSAMELPRVASSPPPAEAAAASRVRRGTPLQRTASAQLAEVTPFTGRSVSALPSLNELEDFDIVDPSGEESQVDISTSTAAVATPGRRRRRRRLTRQESVLSSARGSMVEEG
eukprot:TRINITY_DN2403_c0_g1_i3.p1 TRINITY_DN2403_c0_g1~~TRINITY_DN2403_c0_g1_i3.p1  ORF type:complete len:4686 (-),score=1008.71 TRINITY_DN2403_c0_g1_i3:157-14214(-)